MTERLYVAVGSASLLAIGRGGRTRSAKPDRVYAPHTSRNKRWSSGDMALRWTAAGMLEAERQFRWVIGYRDLAKLAIAIERDLHRPPVSAPNQEAAIVATV